MDFQLLNSKNAAEFLGLSIRTLEKWRLDKTKKLPFINIEGVIKYNKSELIKYLERNTLRRG